MSTVLELVACPFSRPFFLSSIITATRKTLARSYFLVCQASLGSEELSKSWTQRNCGGESVIVEKLISLLVRKHDKFQVSCENRMKRYVVKQQ